MERTAFISAGMLQGRKFVTSIASLNLYLNFGFLGLASLADAAGVPSVVRHGKFTDPSAFAESVFGEGLLEGERPLFLSVPTYYAITWSRAFCKRVKELCPLKRIVAGGRWGLGDDLEWIRTKLPDVDQFVFGTAEERILGLVGASPRRLEVLNIGARGVPIESATSSLPDLNYELMPDYQEFHPSLEMSRGCGLGCTFCQERDARLQPMRSPQSSVGTLLRYRSLYGQSAVRPYFEASFFRPNEPWIDEFGRLWRNAGLDVQWRCESRVDAFSPSMLQRLAASGLKVIDLGLESASATQLRAMKKTQNPPEYLKRAAALLRACADHGVWAKVNFLLFPGETNSTIRETTEFLDTHRSAVKGVSVNPVTIYREPYARRYLAQLHELGASLVDESSLDEVGYGELHLSESIDREAAKKLVFSISKRYMTDVSYFDLKSFSYFPRHMTYNDFSRLIDGVPDDALPFRRTRNERPRTSTEWPDASA
jgi:hypothetical protein